MRPDALADQRVPNNNPLIALGRSPGQGIHQAALVLIREHDLPLHGWPVAPGVAWLGVPAKLPPLGLSRRRSR